MLGWPLGGEAARLAPIRVWVRIGLVLLVVVAFAALVSVVGAGLMAAPKGDVVAGRKVFVASCGGCHTLKAAGTKAKALGLNFDRRREPFARVFRVLVEGQGDMMAFTDRLTFKQLRDVAAFVDASTRLNPSGSY